MVDAVLEPPSAKPLLVSALGSENDNNHVRKCRPHQQRQVIYAMQIAIHFLSQYHNPKEGLACEGEGPGRLPA